LTLAVVKVIDNIVSTEKTILTQKNKALAASILVIIAQFMFYFIIKEVVADSNIVSIIVVSVASGIGSYIAFYMNKKLSRDMVYINIITSNDKSKMKAFGDYMRTENIKIVTMDAYNDDIEKTLTAIVFANTKEQSSKIDNYMKKHDGLYRQIVS
jgi:uncharacterized protein YebE (UPF0316 family)